MALQTIPPILYPTITHIQTVRANGVLDADGEKLGCVFMVPATGTINFIAFRTVAVTTSDTLKVGLYTVDANGDPTATAYGSMVAGTQGSLSANTAYAVELGTGATATKGDMVAIVIEFDSYVAGNLQVAIGFEARWNLPYASLYSAAAWGKLAYPAMAAIGYGTPTPVYPWTGMSVPFSARTALNFNSGSTPNEYALRFNVPFPLRVTGMWWQGFANAGADYDAILYSGTTPITGMTQRVDGDAVAGTQAYLNFVQFDSTAELAKDTEYRLSVKPADATGIRLQRSTYLSSALLGAMGGSAGFYESTRAGGAWSDATDTQPTMGLIIDQLDDGVGAGGESVFVHRMRKPM